MPGGRLGLNHRGVAGSREGSSEDSSAIRFERSVDKQVFSSLPPLFKEGYSVLARLCSRGRCDKSREGFAVERRSQLGGAVLTFLGVWRVWHEGSKRWNEIRFELTWFRLEEYWIKVKKGLASQSSLGLKVDYVESRWKIGFFFRFGGKWFNMRQTF